MLTLMSELGSIDLPSPDYQDKLDIEYRKYVYNSRGGETIISAKPGYRYSNSNQKLNYKFSFVDEQTKQNLFDFLDQNAGMPITITDYNHINWYGIVTNPDSDIVNSARNNNEVTLEIEIINTLQGSYLITQGYLSDAVILGGYTE